MKTKITIFILLALFSLSGFSQSKKEIIELQTMQIDSLNQQIKHIENESISKDAKITELNNTIKKIKDTITEKEEVIKACKISIKECSDNTEKVRTELKERYDQITKLNDSINVLKNTIDAKDEKINDKFH